MDCMMAQATIMHSIAWQKLNQVKKNKSKDTYCFGVRFCNLKQFTR